MSATWGHWCYEQEPTTLPTSTPRCPQCGAINWSALKSSPASVATARLAATERGYRDDGKQLSLIEDGGAA